MDNDFNNQTIGNGWSSTQTVDFSNPCDNGPDGTPHAWMGDNSDNPRSLETDAYDVTCGAEICFHFRMSEQGGGAPCEGPDLDDEGVHLQYSTDNGNTWTDIHYFHPNGGYDAQMTSWNHYCFNIPPAAQTPNTMFRWWQEDVSSTLNDHWGIDNVEIIGVGCGYDYDWPHVSGVPNDSQQTVWVDSDTVFEACYTNMHTGGNDSCCTTINIGIDGVYDMNFDTIIETCDKDDDGEIHVTPVGGTGPYTYQMSGPVNDTNTTGDFVNLPDGNYSFTIVEDGGCTVSDNIELVAGPQCCEIVHDSTSTVDITCHGGSDGEATVYTSNGPTPHVYEWYDGNMNPIGQSSQTATGLDTGTYIVEVMDQDSCFVYDTLTLTQPAPWDVQTSYDSAFCGNPNGAAYVDNVTGNTPGYTYQWNGPGNNQNGIDATNILPGDHDVTITDANGCDTTATVTVPNAGGHNTTIGSTVDVSCFGGSDGEATAQVNGGTAPFTYQWDDPGGQTTQTATGLSAGTYQVVVEDDNGCLDSAEATISEPSPVQVSSSPDTTICIGGTATLSANASGGTPGYTYHWNQGLGTGQVQNVSPGSSTVYEVYAEDANGCTSDPSVVRVEFHPPLSVDALSDDSICPGATSSLAAIGSGGLGSGYSYNWSNGGTGVSTTVAPTTTTTYTVTLEDGCETPVAQDSVEIYVYELPDVQIAGEDLEDCAPVEATLINATDPSEVGTQCVWDFGDGSQGTSCDTITHTYDSPGCYDVSLSVRSPEGCVDSTTVQEMVCVRPYPDADFKPEPKETTVQSPEIEFTNLSTGAVEYSWDLGGLDSSSEEHPTYSFPPDGEGEYEVCMEAVSQYGCSDSTCETVHIGGEMIIYVPNAFTPDGDGINDEFRPVVQGVDEREYDFYVFDRWGEVIYEGHHPEASWDGTVKGSSTIAKPDVYVWKLVTKNKYTGEPVEKEGHVTLLR